MRRNQLAGALHGIDAKQENVVDRERHRDETEAECHRRDDGERGERRAVERAERDKGTEEQRRRFDGASRSDARRHVEPFFSAAPFLRVNPFPPSAP
jgi:hypothetical protein